MNEESGKAAEKINESEIIELRLGKVKDFFKKKYSWTSYVVLAFIVFLSIKIRTLPLSGLKDITTGTWTLGPDLDPFLFLRWAKYIIAHGSLMVNDTFRYVPLGYNTKGELILLPYLIAWFHKFASFLGFSGSVEQSAVLFSVFFFALTVISFFLLVRKMFVSNLGELKANVTALISSLFLSILPALLPRTIAGIPEKESAGFFFLFISLYFFISAWKAGKLRNRLLLGLFAGITMAMMALVWGGWTYISLTVSLSLFISLILGKCKKEEIYITLIWLIPSWIIMSIYSTRYSWSNLLTSTITLIALVMPLFMLVNLLISNNKFGKYFELGFLKKVPKPIVSIGIALIFGAILGSVVFGISFIPDKIGDITTPLIQPITDRL